MLHCLTIMKMNGGGLVLREAELKELLPSPIAVRGVEHHVDEAPGVHLCRHCSAHTAKLQKLQALPLLALCWRG